MITYIKNKLDEFDKTIGNSGFYQDALGIENYNEITKFIKQSLTDYHSHIVEKIMNLVKTTGHPYMFSLTEERFEKDLRSLLQDTNINN